MTNLMDEASAWLKTQGFKAELISMRTVIKKNREAHLFKGKLGDKTVRYVAIIDSDGEFVKLEEISTTERKWVGRTARTDLGAYRVRQAERRSKQKKVRKRKIRKFAPKAKREV